MTDATFSHAADRRGVADAVIAPGWPWAYALFGVFVAACATAWLTAGMVVPWDSKNHFYPMFRYLGASLASGELPLWNPYHFSGHPTAADPQSLLFTPTMALFAWLMPDASMAAFDIMVLLHLAAGGAAVMALFQRRGWNATGAVLAAMIFAIGGVASSRLQHTGIVISYALIPVALLALENALARATIRAGALFGLAAGLLALGRDQVAFLGCLTLLGAAASALATAPAPLAWIRTRAAALGMSGAIALAIVAVPALLTLQFLGGSNRPAFGFGVAAMGSLPPVSLATFVWPNVFGSLNWDYSYFGPMPETVTGGTWMERASTYLFIGSFPALMILGFGVARGRLVSREIAFFVGLAALGLLYAFGRYTPVFGWLFDHMPGVSLYRRPADALFLVNFALAMIAGWLLHRFIAEPREGYAPHPVQRLTGIAAALLTGAALVALAVWAIVFSDDRRDGEAMRAVLGVAPFAAAALVMAFGWRGHRVAVAAALVAVTGGELVWRNAANSMNAEPASRYAIFDRLPADHVQALKVLKTALDAHHRNGERPRVEIIGMPNAWQNAAMVLGIEDTIGYNPLRIAQFARAIGPGENAEDYNARTFPRTFRGYSCKLATLLGLEYLVLGQQIETLPAHFPRVGNAELLFGGDKVFVYHLKQAAPRAYVAHGVVAAGTDETIVSGELPDFDRKREALVDEADLPLISPALAQPAPAGSSPASARIVSFRRNEVRIAVETDRLGLLVLHDLHYPGWVATVGGVQTPVVRANLLFRGVEVPSGRHEVVFSFRPFSAGNLSGIVGRALQSRRLAEDRPALAVR